MNHKTHCAYQLDYLCIVPIVVDILLRRALQVTRKYLNLSQSAFPVDLSSSVRSTCDKSEIQSEQVVSRSAGLAVDVLSRPVLNQTVEFRENNIILHSL